MKIQILFQNITQKKILRKKDVSVPFYTYNGSLITNIFSKNILLCVS